MDKDKSEDCLNLKDSEEEKSFVTKVRSRVSGLFNSSISKIFGSQEKRESVIRRRENDDDIYENQPPCKKAKGPLGSSNFMDKRISNFNHLYGMNSLGDASTTLFTNLIEPVAGPSGGTQTNFHKTVSSSISSRKEIINDEKDSDSGESTSGYSSMPRMCKREVVRPILEPKNTSHQSISKFSSEKEAVQSKKLFDNSTPERSSRSLFADSSLSPSTKNKSLSSRRPSSNTSNFSSPNFIDRTVTTNRIINSPFYNGPTVYGGASAYNRQIKGSESRKQQLKHSFIVKPVNKEIANYSCNSLSKTARRILNALEQYSAPINDADKIPLPTKIEKKEGLLSKYVGVNPYRLRESRVPSNKELLVPSVPELLRMKQKQRLQDTTDKIRQIATSSKISLNTEYKICEDNQQKHTNKMKTKVSSLRSKTPAVEVLENVVLKSVPLTLPENKLPKFDLVIPPPDSLKSDYTKKMDIRACVESTFIPSQKLEVKESKRSDFITEFTFAKPVVIADNLKSIVAINNFKFSEPLSKHMGLNENDNNKTISVPKEFEIKEVKTNKNLSMSNPTQNSVSCINSDIDLMEKFKAPEGSWSCSTCLIRNKKEAEKCVACETLRASQSPKVCIKLKVKADEWECSSCFIRNSNQHVKCVACSSPKVSINIFKSNGFEKRKREIDPSKSIRQGPQITYAFGDKFNLASDTWECQTCLVRNKANVEKCIACESKRGQISEKVFNSQLNTSKDTWECDTCLIRNKNELQNCAACQTPKEKVFVSLGSDKLNRTSDKWECSTCMVRNDNSINKCPCCETPKAGVTLINKNTVNMFNFGVNKTQFNFGIPKVQTDQLEISSGLSVTSSINKSSLGIVKISTSSESNSESKANDKSIELKIDKNGQATPVLPSDGKNTEAVPVFKFGSSSLLTKPTSENPGSSSQQLNPIVSDASNISNFTNTHSENIKLSSTKQLTPNICPKTSPLNPVVKDDSKAMMQASIKFDTVASGSTPSAFSLLDNQKPKSLNNFSTTAEPKIPFTFEKTNPGSFISFGKTENPSSKAVIKPVFSFGNSALTSEGFSFNPNAATSKQSLEGIKPKPTGGFMFNKPKPDTSIFDTSAIPVNTKNGGFNFGNAPVTNNQAAVFSFGASQNLPQTRPNSSQNSSGGFNFSSAVCPTGGFNFSASAPAFDASIKPSFNFTGGTAPTFAATPSETGGPTAVRKFKKAVRRAAQR